MIGKISKNIFALFISSALVVAALSETAFLCLSRLVVTSSAAEVSYNMSDQYAASEYYENLSKVTLSGNQATDVIAVALSQLGYHEGDSDGELDGQSVSGCRDFVEYNVLYGKLDNGQGNGTSYGYYWCASFVNWCLRQAGVSKDASAGGEVSCQRWLSDCKESEIYFSKNKGLPKTGDMIFFKDTGSSLSATHMGLVLYCDGISVYTVEGNSSNQGDFSSDGDRVAMRSYPLNSKYIVGYASPKYENKNSTKKVDHSGELLTEGQYITKVDVDVYNDSQLTKVSATISAFEIFDVVSVRGTTMQISYKTKQQKVNGYIKYEQNIKQMNTTRDVYAVNYYDGDRAVLSTQYVLPDGSVTLHTQKPTKDKNGFVGWSTAKSSSEASFFPADNIQSCETDVALYAVWDPNFYVVSFINPDEDGTIIGQRYGYYGTVFEVPEVTSIPEGYVFAGWDREVDTTIRGDVSYTAKFVLESELSQTQASGGCASAIGGSSAIALVAISALSAARITRRKDK